MRHIPDGTLRRLVDEPFAVADGDAAHAALCPSCAGRRAQIARDAAVITALLVRPQPVPDLDLAWNRLRYSSLTTAQAPPKLTGSRRPHSWRRRLVTVRVPPPAVMATVALVLVALALTITFTTVLGPSGPAPVASSPAGIKAIEDVVGIDQSGVLGGFNRASGSLSLPFGTLQWTSPGAARQVNSLNAAEQATGLPLRALSLPPSGVGGATTILVQPAVTATVRLGAAAGALAGQALTIAAGPAVLVEYGSAPSAIGLPTLATFEMARPLVSSVSGTAAQVEAYLLSQPGLPAGLAEEIRLLGGVEGVVPLPGSSGANMSQVDVDGYPAVLVTDSSLGASGVIWEGRDGLVQAAAGLLDSKDILNVASQLG